MTMPSIWPDRDAGPEADVVTDPERPGEEQHEPGEQVGQRLLCRDAEQDADDGPADQQLLHVNVGDGQREGEDGEDADEDQDVPQHARVRLADQPLRPPAH